MHHEVVHYVDPTEDICTAPFQKFIKRDASQARLIHSARAKKNPNRTLFVVVSESSGSSAAVV